MRTPLWFLGICALIGCGGQDPGGSSTPQPADQQVPANAGASGRDDDASAAAVDAAPPAVNDPIVPGTPVNDPSNAFTGAGPYASDPPSLRANDQHAGGAIVTGQPCLQCHDGTTCVKFDFAGTIWQYPALTTGAADVQIRIIDANDVAYSVHSDVDGNFWHRADSDLALPAYSGVRVADWQALGTLNGVSCNTCHNTGTTVPGRLYVHS